MHIGKHRFALAAAALIALLLCGCARVLPARSELDHPQPTVLSAAVQAAPTAQPTPDAVFEPEPAPSPEPTQTPFSALAPTVEMSFEELVGDNGIYEKPTGWPDADTYYTVVDIRHQVVMVYEKDASGEYTVPVRYMVCTSGANRSGTPCGTFRTGEHRVRFGYFSGTGVFGQYWTNITGRIYFHTLLYGDRDASTYTTSSYKLLGKRGSHGCVRLLVPDARWIYYHLAPGSVVTVRRGSADDEATAAIKAQLVRAELPKERPDIRPGGVPYTDNWRISELRRYWLRPVDIIEGTKRTVRGISPLPMPTPVHNPM